MHYRTGRDSSGAYPTPMLTNSSILITGGSGSFGNTFVPTTLAKYNPKRLVIYSRDEMKQWDMAHKIEGDGRVRFFTSITNEFDPNTVRRFNESLYLGTLLWVSNPIASAARQGLRKESRRNASCTTAGLIIRIVRRQTAPSGFMSRSSVTICKRCD